MAPPAQVLIVSPAARGSRSGNRVTAVRWAAHLRSLGHRVALRERWGGEPADLLIALHAVKSAAAVQAFHTARPESPIIVALAGTDLYGDEPLAPEGRASLEAATRIVALQPAALEALPAALRERARVIHQSVRLPAGVTPRTVDDARIDTNTFEVLLLAHVRPVKDPLLPARASRLLPPDSRLHIVHAGAVLDEELGRAALRESAENSRYDWIGELTRRECLARLSSTRLLVAPSRHEGGANVLSEALALHTPILATRIPGAVGMLGAGHPGLFPVGDADELARLFTRAEHEPRFLSELTRASAARAGLFEPAREQAAWRALLAEVLAP